MGDVYTYISVEVLERDPDSRVSCCQEQSQGSKSAGGFEGREWKKASGKRMIEEVQEIEALLSLQVASEMLT